jgi:hypothetical protein
MHPSDSKPETTSSVKDPPSAPDFWADYTRRSQDVPSLDTTTPRVAAELRRLAERWQTADNADGPAPPRAGPSKLPLPFFPKEGRDGP